MSAVIGFTAQTVMIAIQYFSFLTKTHVSMEVQQFIPKYGISLCIRYADILDKERLSNETGLRFDAPHTLTDAIQNEGKLTVRQIFEYTPAADSAIDRCHFRSDPWLLTEKNGRDCDSEFRVDKFLMPEFMCYHIIQQQDRRLNTQAATRSTFHQNVIFNLYLSKAFADADNFNLIISVADRPIETTRVTNLPDLSCDHSPIISVRDQVTHKRLFNNIHLTPSYVTVKLLPAPYDTACINVRGSQVARCRRDCLARKLRPFNRLPRREILTEAVDMITITTADMKNASVGPRIRTIEQTCRNRCNVKLCSEKYTITSYRLLGSLHKSFKMTLMVATDPRTIVETEASMSFVDFFCFASGCCCTWFGVSFSSLKPRRRNVGMCAELHRWGKKLLTLILTACSVVGFCLQVFNIGLQFFAFKTTTHVSVQTLDEIPANAIIACMRVRDIVDRERLLSETGVRVGAYEMVAQAMAEEGKLTIKQSLDYTPSANNTIAGCMMRPDSWQVAQAKEKSCFNKFKVLKFFMTEFMCYKISPSQHVVMLMEDVSRSTIFKNEIFSVFLNESFADTDLLFMMVSRGILPYNSRDHGAWARLKDPSTVSNKLNFVTLTPYDVRTTLLTAPYDTGCVMKEAGDRAACRLRCLLLKLEQINRVPGYELLTLPYDLVPVTTADILNTSTGPYIRRAHYDCVRKCHFTPCIDGFTVTHTHTRVITDQESIRWPLPPHATFSHDPHQRSCVHVICRLFLLRGRLLRRLVWLVFPVPQIQHVSQEEKYAKKNSSGRSHVSQARA